MRISSALLTTAAMFASSNAEDLNCGYFDADCWWRQLNQDVENSAEYAYNTSQCAYYFKEGMEGDYYGGVNWDASYDI